MDLADALVVQELVGELVDRGEGVGAVFLVQGGGGESARVGEGGGEGKGEHAPMARFRSLR